MTDNLNAKARIEVEARFADLHRLVEEMDRGSVSADDLREQVEGLERAVGRSGRANDSAAKSLKGAADSATQASKATSLYNQYLYDQNRALGNTKTQLESYRQALSRAQREQQRAGSARVSQNLSHIPANTPAPQVGVSFGNVVNQDDRATQQASRSYSNLSTQIDGTIDARRRESRAASETIRLRMEEGAATSSQTQSIIASRYALYDVASTAGIASAALLGLTTATVGFAASYESSFTNVERTTLASGEKIENLRRQLLDLTRDIPLAFSDVTEIASLGAQLGIADDALEGFTRTVAQFSAASNVSVDAAGMAFGALGELLDVSTADYERLGSAIAYVGVNSVATESEILSMSQRLAASAANAGFSAQEVVALSGALASLRVAPERAQGVMEVYFRTLNKAIAEGGDRLDAYAQVTGVAASEIEGLVKADPVGFFRRLAEGLGSLDSTSTTLALNELGLSGIRAGEVFTRVSNNVGVFDRALSDSNSAYAEGTFLAEVYGKRVDDIASRIQILLNGLQELAAEIGSSLTPVLGPLIDGVTTAINHLSDLFSSDFGKALSGVSLGLTAVMGAMLALVSAVALGVASLYAFRTAAIGLGLNQATTGLAGFAGGMVGVSTATGGAAVALRVFRVALASTGIGLAVVALGTLAAAFMGAGVSAETAFQRVVGTTAGLSDAVQADTAAFYDAIIAGNTELASKYTVLSLAADENSVAFEENGRVAANVSAILGTDAPSSFDAATGAIHTNTVALGENSLAWLRNQLFQSDAFRALGENQDFVNAWTAIGADFDTVIKIQAEQGQQGVYNYFVDLANAAEASGKITIAQIDAISVGIGNALLAQRGMIDSSLATPGFFGDGPLGDVANIVQGYLGQISLIGGAMDGTTIAMDDGAEATDGFGSSLGRAGKAAGAATREVRTLVDYASDLSGVMSRAFDIRFGGQQGLDAITSGWRGIADAIAKANQEVAEHQSKLTGLRADKGLREYWLSVAENYGDDQRAAQLRAELAEINVNIAKTEEDLSKARDKTNKSLEGNSTAAIENRAEILGLVGEYQDYITALASSGMSQGDLRRETDRLKQDFIAQATQLGYNSTELGKYTKAFDDVRVAINGVPRNITVSANVNPALQALNEFKAAAAKAGSAAGSSISKGITEGMKKVGRAGQIQATIAYYQELIAKNPTHKYYRDALADYSRVLASGNYWTGGYVGDGGKFEPKGIVHGGEFVFSKEATKNLGVGNLAYLHKAAQQGRRAMSAGYAASTVAGAGAGMSDGYMSLSPTDRRLLQDIARRSGLTISAGPLQAAVGAANVNGNNRGAY